MKETIWIQLMMGTVMCAFLWASYYHLSFFIHFSLLILHYISSAIFAAISAARPRADVAYCIHALARRLAKTRNWAVRVLSQILSTIFSMKHEEIDFS